MTHSWAQPPELGPAPQQLPDAYILSHWKMLEIVQNKVTGIY